MIVPADHGGTVMPPWAYKPTEHASLVSAMCFCPKMSVLLQFSGWQKLILTTTQGMCTRRVICQSSCPSPECGWFYHLCLWPSPSRGWRWGSRQEAFLSQEVKKCKRHLLSFPETSAGKVGTQVTVLGDLPLIYLPWLSVKAPTATAIKYMYSILASH